MSDHAISFAEFANGGAQCHAMLFDGTMHSGLLVSNGTAIIAMWGEATLPFAVDLIDCLFQTAEDLNPTARDGWQYFDEWMPT